MDPLTTVTDITNAMQPATTPAVSADPRDILEELAEELAREVNEPHDSLGLNDESDSDSLNDASEPDAL